jgi:hypothetical protein
MKLQKILLLIPILLLISNQQVKASHLYAVEITYRCLSNNQYIVQLEAFQDCGGLAAPNSLSIQANSTCTGSQTIPLPQTSITDITPVCPGGTSPCLTSGYGTYHVIYSDTITLPNCNDWSLSHTDCCRSNNIVNLANSFSSIHGQVTLDNSSTCNNAALSNNTAYIYSKIGLPQNYYINAYDLDGDSLVFIQTEPLGNAGNPEAYSMPHSITNPLGNSSTFNLNSSTGEISFTANAIGFYIVGIRVEEYRNGLLIASSNKDLNIAVSSASTGSNSTPNYTVSNVQGGYLDQNIFYITNSSQLSFDITAIDTADVNDTLTFSSSINTIGGGFTSTGVNPVTASFTWPVSSSIPQNFMVEVTDNHCSFIASGAQLFGFAILVLDHCVPDSIVGVVPSDSIFKISGNCNNNNGFPITAITSSTTTTYGSLSIAPNQSSLLYQAGSSYEVQESFWVHFEMNGGLQADSIWVDVTTASCVWAGDADTNNVVNNFDLLPLGLGYGETGAMRPNAGIDYDCEPALDFVNNTPMTGINYKHSDTNGDGIVNADDTTAILLNWGQIHLKNNSTTPLNAIPFYVEPTMALSGQMLQIPIILGDTAVLADSIYGVAFTINYDEVMTDTSSVSVDFNTSWLGTINSDMISVQKDFYYQGKIEVAVVRTDQINRDGMGQIGTLNLTIKDDILKSTTQRLDLLISNVRIITNIGTERLASTPPTDILVSTITSTDDITATTTYVNVFPNPAKTNLNIQSNDKIEWINLYNLAGQELQSVQVQDLNTQLNIQHLAQGMYILTVQTTQGIQTQKIQIVR